MTEYSLALEITDLRESLTAARAELASLRRDKERLDWLEETGHSISPMFDPAVRWAIQDETVAEVVTPKPVFGMTLREAIDAARATPHVPSPGDPSDARPATLTDWRETAERLLREEGLPLEGSTRAGDPGWGHRRILALIRRIHSGRPVESPQ